MSMWDEMLAEKVAQDTDGDPRTHVDGTEASYLFNRESVRATTAERFAAGEGTWRDLLHVRMADVFAETDPTALRALLVSTAATVARWVEDIDLRAQPPAE